MSAFKLTAICLSILPWLVAPAHANDHDQPQMASIDAFISTVSPASPLLAVPQEPVSRVPQTETTSSAGPDLSAHHEALPEKANPVARRAYTPIPTDITLLLLDLREAKDETPPPAQDSQDDLKPPPVIPDSPKPVVATRPQYVVIQLPSQVVLSPPAYQPQIIIVQAPPQQSSLPAAQETSPQTMPSSASTSTTAETTPNIADLSKLQSLFQSTNPRFQQTLQPRQSWHQERPYFQQERRFAFQRPAAMMPRQYANERMAYNPGRGRSPWGERYR